MSEIRVNRVVSAEGTSAPNLPYGVQVPTGMGITGAGGINISGVCTAGIITATNLYGTLNGNSTGLTGTPNISCGTIAGSTGTFSGAVNVDDTTDSTSATSGSLIVDGGLGVAKNVYIGAGLSVAGTLTYEDVTSVDSVGMVTAKSGVNVSGGQLQVGVAYSVGAAGVATALGLVAGASGFEQTGGGEFKVGIGVTISSTTGVSTFGSDVTFTGDGGKSCVWSRGNAAFELNDDALIKIGNGADLRLYHDGSNSYVEGSGTGELRIRGRSVRITDHDGSENFAVFNDDGAVDLYFDNSKKFETTNDGAIITGITTFSRGCAFNSMLKEEVNIVANKLSAGTNIDIDDGMIWYYSTNETTTATPNIRYNSSKSLNNMMSTGQAVTVTIIYKPNGAGYYAALTVDGSGVTEEWNGGSAPSSANAGGYDVLTHTLVKTADASFICLSNVQNYA